MTKVAEETNKRGVATHRTSVNYLDDPACGTVIITEDDWLVKRKLFLLSVVVTSLGLAGCMYPYAEKKLGNYNHPLIV